MTRVMTVSEARAALPEILERVRAGEEVMLTRHGEPVAVVVRPDRLRARRADAALAGATEVDDLLVEAQRTKLRARPTVEPDRADALLAEVRAGRSGR